MTTTHTRQLQQYTQDNYNITHNEVMAEEIMVTWYCARANLQALAANFPQFVLRSNTVKVESLFWNVHAAATDIPTLHKRLGYPLLTT